MSMTNALRADLHTTRHSRTVWWVWLTAALLGVLLTGSLVYTFHTDEPVADLATAFGQGEVLIDPVSGLVIAALTASLWGAAYRDGSVLWSFLAEERRAVVAVAALASSALVGLAMSATVILLKVLTLHLFLPVGLDVTWWQDAHGRTAVAGAVVSGVSMALLGTAASLLTRNAAAAIGILFGWLLVLEPLLVSLLPRSTWTWLPGHAISSIRNAVPDVDLTRSATMVVVYLAAACLAATAVTARRDPA